MTHFTYNEKQQAFHFFDNEQPTDGWLPIAVGITPAQSAAFINHINDVFTQAERPSYGDMLAEYHGFKNRIRIA